MWNRVRTWHRPTLYYCRKLSNLDFFFPIFLLLLFYRLIEACIGLWIYLKTCWRSKLRYLNQSITIFKDILSIRSLFHINTCLHCVFLSFFRIWSLKSFCKLSHSEKEYCIAIFMFLTPLLFWDIYSEIYHPLAAESSSIHFHFSHFSLFLWWIFFAFCDTISFQEKILILAYLEMCLKCKHSVAFQYIPN